MKRVLSVLLGALFCVLIALPGCRTMPPDADWVRSETPAQAAAATPAAEATSRVALGLDSTARTVPTLQLTETAKPVRTPLATQVFADPAPSASPDTLPSDKKSIIVYVTKTGSKYHRAGCSYLSKSCIETTLADAIAKGYTPCSKCRPPE